MKKIMFIMLLTAVSSTFAQLKIEGVVKDSIGNPLELANVIAINQQTQKLESYGITNQEGRYKLSVEKNSKYKLQVSYIGMKTAQIDMVTIISDIVKDISLEYDNTLDEIELVYEMPVVVKGDTIVYNADSFTSGTERKLGDLLNKLPGVEVNDEGQIEVEGKTVGKVMVEGKDFFDGDSKLATQNIPANAIDKVEVLKNYAEVGQLSGVTNNQDNIAINIKLKQGKKNFWFGNVTAGLGDSKNNTLYLAQPKLFYYSPEYSINFIGDLNNIGEIAFTRRDYFNFTGGFRSPSRSSGTNIDLGSNNLGFLSLQNNRAKDINTKFGAANFSYSPKKTLDVSGFAIFSSSRTALQENNAITYTDASLGIPDENTESNTMQRSDLGMLKFSTKYKPNTSNQLDYDVLARTSKESQDQLFFSSVNGNILQLEKSSPFSINQNLNYYYTLNDKNIFAFEVQHLFQDENPFYNAFLEDKASYLNTATVLGLDDSQSGFNIAQDKRVKSNQVDAKLDYWNILNQKSDINFTAGTIYSKQDFNSNIFQFLDDNSTFETTPTINNSLDFNKIAYTFSDVYLALHYRLKSGIFTFTPGVSAHAYSSKNNQFNINFKDNFFRLLPDFNMIMQLKKSEQIVFNYRMQTSFTDINQLARGLVLNNYRSIFSGNQELESALAHNVSLSYFSFNMFNYTNVNARISYTKTIDRIRTTSQFEPGSVVNVSSPFNSGLNDESASAFGRAQKTFGKFRAMLSGNFSYNKFNQLINNRASANENYSQTYRTSLGTNFREAPNFEIGYRYTIQDNDQGSSRTKFYTKAPSIEFDALIFKSFTFKTEYSYNNFSDEDRTINDYEFWDASLAYKKNKDSKWEYELKATNLLDTKSQNTSNTGSISVSATEYYIQPRFLTFRLRYEL
ncbi:MAG: outer membrane beta-barrel protein [Flavobacteriales bacterium]|nr:outer membrane beta-barrel protein [Flavobacteriales bacterium]NCP61242.1 outer membrane beta-barrel protein [Flavobacteriales bacterium]NCQ58344.1 outer membrane beta-barrel protein [Flavobacteriales bacterium]